MNTGKDDNRPPPVPDKYRQERVGPDWTRNSDLKKIWDEFERLHHSLDEIKQATFAGEYHFEQYATTLADWIEETLGTRELAAIQVLVPRWGPEALAHFFSERDEEWLSKDDFRMLDFIVTETEGLCFLDYERFPGVIDWDDDGVPESMAKRAAHRLNRNLVHKLWEVRNGLITP